MQRVTVLVSHADELERSFEGADDNIEMVRSRPVTALYQDDIQMQDASEPGRAQASAPHKLELALMVQDCFEDIEDKNNAIAKLLRKLQQRFLRKDYKSIHNVFTDQRIVHQECLSGMKVLFWKSSSKLPDCQVSQLVFDERRVSVLQQSLQILKKSQRNLQDLIDTLGLEQVLSGKQLKVSSSRAVEVSVGCK